MQTRCTWCAPTAARHLTAVRQDRTDDDRRADDSEITPAYGVSVTVELWRPGMPQPDKWANPTQVTYVIRVVDRSQIEGQTKTVLDSALAYRGRCRRFAARKTLDPLQNPGNQYVPRGCTSPRRWASTSCRRMRY